MAIPIKGGFGDVEATDFSLLPSGTYAAEITDFDERTSGENAKHPGTPYLNWEFTITEGDYKDRKQWTNTSLHENAMGMLKSFLLGVGYTEEELGVDDFELDPDAIVGRTCRIVVRIRKNRDTKEEENSVRQILPEGDASDDLPT